MFEEMLEYVATQRVGVLAFEMPDGSPHAATVHFAHSPEPLVFYFETNREYRKAEALLQKKSVRASFVIGTDESTMKTLQLDGIAELITPGDREAFDSIYFARFPKKKEKITEASLLFRFTPLWWRYTDWTKPSGKKILASAD